MSFSENSSNPSITAQELLAFNQDQLRQFLNGCRTDDGFDISRISDLDRFSGQQRDELVAKLNNAAIEAGPLDIDALASLLGQVANDATRSKTNGSSLDRYARSENSSQSREKNSAPDIDNNRQEEAYCHDALEQAGGQPVMSFALLLEALEKDSETNKELLRPWLGDIDFSQNETVVPPIFSAQLGDWTKFKFSWQWDNRGRFASEEGFNAFLESQKRRWIQKGASTMTVSDPSFEATTRRQWDYQQRYLESSGRAGFSAYAEAVKARLASHNFTQQLNLAEDPRQQDAWTTWVEYLNYVYWWQDRHAISMRAARPRARKAWDELKRFQETQPEDPPAARDVDEELNSVREQLEEAMQRIRGYLQKSHSYHDWEADVRRQELRAQWVLSLLPSMSAIPAVQLEGTIHNSSEGSKRKRKRANDDVTTDHDTADHVDDYAKKTIQELRNTIKARNIPSTGLKLKKDYVERLQEWDRSNPKVKRLKLAVRDEEPSLLRSKIQKSLNLNTPRRRSARLRSITPAAMAHSGV